MTRVLLASLMMLGLSGCASEINKPIRPNDPWLSKGAQMDDAVYRD